MMLLTQGYGVQKSEWHVDEATGPGYSRMYLMEGGSAVYRQNEQTVVLQKDMLYLFPATVPFSIHHDPQAPLCCIWLHFDTFPALISSLVCLPAGEGTVLRCLLDILKGQILLQRCDTPFFQSMGQAFAHYLQELHVIEPEENKMLDVLEYLRENFHKSTLDINSLSATWGYSPEHFIRTFTQAVKITPYQYLLNMRLSHAQRLLLENVPVKKVAAAVGYQNARTFSHAFQKKYFIAPSRYKKYYAPIA